MFLFLLIIHLGEAYRNMLSSFLFLSQYLILCSFLVRPQYLWSEGQDHSCQQKKLMVNPCFTPPLITTLVFAALLKEISILYHFHCSLVFFFCPLGTDEAAIIQILSSRTSEERQQIKQKYKATYGKVIPRVIEKNIHSALDLDYFSYNFITKAAENGFKPLFCY